MSKKKAVAIGVSVLTVAAGVILAHWAMENIDPIDQFVDNSLVNRLFG